MKKHHFVRSMGAAALVGSLVRTALPAAAVSLVPVAQMGRILLLTPRPNPPCRRLPPPVPVGVEPGGKAWFYAGDGMKDEGCKAAAAAGKI